jgi:hypothetical protein
MTNPKCISCDNTEPEQLGSEIQDNFADIDYYCSKCGNLFSTHYDATSFKQAQTERLLEKYPDLKDKIQQRDQNLVNERSNTLTVGTTATKEGGTAEEKSQNVALNENETQNQNNTVTQSPTAQTNEKNIERQNQSEQQTLKKANTT